MFCLWKRTFCGSALLCSRSLLYFSNCHVHLRDDVRNVAVIAHVDHGKTTLVDSMLSQSGTLLNAHNRVMDSKDQERERGITILAKNTAIVLNNGNSKQRRINVVDTPGHLDFSGEVERALQMVEGILLLVDAKEGVRPGTRYVLRKALGLNLKPIVCVNKIDKDDSRVEKTVEEIEDLFLETAEHEDSLDIKFLYGSGRDGYMNETVTKQGTLQPLFDNIFEVIPPPRTDDANSLQMLVAQIGEVEGSELKIAIGRLFAGKVCVNDVVTVALEDKKVDALVRKIFLFRGVEQVPVESASFGDICIMHLEEPQMKKIPLKIGATIGEKDVVKLLPYRKPDDPTYSLIVQNSEASWKGKEAQENFGRLLNIQKRLEKEAMVNTALQLSGLNTPQIMLKGRGPLHLSVIIEDMRREGYEFEVLAPTVITKVIDGKICEPYEKMSLEFMTDKMSDVISMLSARMAEIGEIESLSNDRSLLECILPVRLMSTFPLKFHTLTGGDGVLHHQFDSYRPVTAAIEERETGALIAVESGEATDWALSGFSTQGRFFILPGDYVYYGQIIGENTKTAMQNLGINVCKRNEQLGGFRSNVNDKAKQRKLSSNAQRFTFEDCISWVTDDELVTVTPKSIRIRKPKFNGKTSMRTVKSKNSAKQ